MFKMFSESSAGGQSKAQDMVAALRDVNGRYVGNRPVRLKKSNWKEKQNTGRVVG